MKGAIIQLQQEKSLNSSNTGISLYKKLFLLLLLRFYAVDSFDVVWELHSAMLSSPELVQMLFLLLWTLSAPWEVEPIAVPSYFQLNDGCHLES